MLGLCAHFECVNKYIDAPFRTKNREARHAALYLMHPRELGKDVAYIAFLARKNSCQMDPA